AACSPSRRPASRRWQVSWASRTCRISAERSDTSSTRSPALRCFPPIPRGMHEHDVATQGVHGVLLPSAASYDALVWLYTRGQMLAKAGKKTHRAALDVEFVQAPAPQPTPHQHRDLAGPHGTTFEP